MSKKDFKGGLDSLLQPSTDNQPKAPKRKQGRPKTSTREITKSSQENTREGETRATFIMSMEQVEKIKAVAYYERKKIKNIIERAIQDYLGAWEKANGKLKPRPKEVREAETFKEYTPKY